MGRLILSNGVIHSDEDFELRSGTDANLRTRFRICSRNDQHTKIKSLSAHDVSIENSLCVKGDLTVVGTCTVQYCTLTSCTSAVQNNFVVTSTDDSGTAAPDLKLYRESASPANNDTLGHIQFSGKDSAGNETEYAGIRSCIRSVTSGSECGVIINSVNMNGASCDIFRVENTGAWVLNNRQLYLTGTGSLRNYGANLNLTTGGGSYDVVIKPNDAEAGRIGADCTSRFGGTELGSWPANTDYAYFGHKALDHSQGCNYAVLQQCTGRTFINSNTCVSFRICNSDKLRYTNTNFCSFLPSIFTSCVGVGTASPTAKLDVRGTGTDGDEVFRIESGGNVNDGGYHWMTSEIASGQTTDANIIHLIGRAQNSKNSGYFGFNYQADAADCNFITLGGYAANHLLNITMGGDVGIGTTSPDVKLHVSSGDIRIGNGNKVYLYESNSANYLAYNRWEVNTSTALAINNAGTGGFQIQDSSVPVLFVGTDSTYGGKVGVGTTCPNKTLEVEYVSSSTNVTCEGLHGGGAGKGLLIYNNNQSTDYVYANLDFRARNADGRIAYQYQAATNVGDFHFITDNTGAPQTMMVIKNDGNVGIGETTPLGKLHVKDGPAIIEQGDLYIASSSGAEGGEDGGGTGKPSIYFGESEGTTVLNYGMGLQYNGDGAGGDCNVLYTLTNAGVCGQLAVQYGGNVGIGTITPGSRLHVYKQGTDSDVLICGAASGADARVLISGYESSELWLDRNGVGRWAFRRQTGTDDLYLYKQTDAYADNGVIQFWDYSSGNVGIGTTNPARKFDVRSGDINIDAGKRYLWSSGDAAILSCGYNMMFETYTGSALTEKVRIQGNGQVGFGTSTLGSNNVLTITNVGNSASYSAIALGTATTGTGNGEGYWIGMQENGCAYLWNYENQPILFGTNTTERMRILGSGNVGIGTTNPYSPLQVHSSADQKILLSGSTNPYIRWQCGSSNRAYIQWIESGSIFGFFNSVGDNFDFFTHDSGAINLRLKGSDGDIWGSLYATDNSGTHQVGILDGDQHWAAKHVNDTCWEFLTNNQSRMFINSTGVYSASKLGFCYPSNCGPYFEAGGSYSAPSVFLKRHDGTTSVTCLGAGVLCGSCCVISNCYIGNCNIQICPNGGGYGIFMGPSGTGQKEHWTTSVFTASSTQARRAKLLEFTYNTHHWDSGGPIRIELYRNYYGKGSYQLWQIEHTGTGDSGTGSQNCTAGSDLPAGARDVVLRLLESNGQEVNQFKLHVDMHASGLMTTSYDVGIGEVYIDVDQYAQVLAKVTLNGTWANITTGTSFSNQNQYKFYHYPVSYTNICSFHNDSAQGQVPNNSGRSLYACTYYGSPNWQIACSLCSTDITSKYLSPAGTSKLTTVCASTCLYTSCIKSTNQCFSGNTNFYTDTTNRVHICTVNAMGSDGGGWQPNFAICTLNNGHSLVVKHCPTGHWGMGLETCGYGMSIYSNGGTSSLPGLRICRGGAVHVEATFNGCLCASTCVFSPFVCAATMCSNTCVDTPQVNLTSDGLITFYGNGSSNHAIMNRDAGGNVADDIRINSYGAVHVNLDSNNNNTANAGFNVYRHGGGTGNLSDLLFAVDGEGSATCVFGDLCVTGSVIADGMVGDCLASQAVCTGTICFNTGCVTGLDAVYDVYVSSNPNCGGSTQYRDIVHMTVYVTTGWNGSAVTKYINHVNNFVRGAVHDSGGGSVTAVPKLLVGTTGCECYAAACATCLQIQVAGGSYKYDTCVKIKQVL